MERWRSGRVPCVDAEDGGNESWKGDALILLKLEQGRKRKETPRGPNFDLLSFYLS